MHPEVTYVRFYVVKLSVAIDPSCMDACLYRGTSLARNYPPFKDCHRALGIVLL